MSASLSKPRVWVVDDFVPIQAGDESFDYQETTTRSVVVRIDFGDGVGRTITWLDPESFELDDVNRLVEKWQGLAENIGAGFEDLINYAEVAETLAEREGGE